MRPPASNSVPDLPVSAGPDAARLQDMLRHQPIPAARPCATRAPQRLRHGADEYLLTLADDAAQLEADLALTRHLRERGLPCARPLSAATALGVCHAALLELPAGQTRERLDAGQCAAVGAMLARLHQAATDYSPARGPWRGGGAWKAAGQALAAALPAADAALVAEELRFQGLFRYADLPRGTVHGAFTRAALWWQDEAISGIAGLGRAGTDTLLYDVAVSALDSCMDDDILDPPRARRLLEGYTSIRPLTAMERGAWPVLLRAAALSAWMAAQSAPDAARARRALLHLINNEAGIRGLWPAATRPRPG